MNISNSNNQNINNDKISRTKTKKHLWYLNKMTTKNNEIPTNINQSKKIKIKNIDKLKKEIEFLENEIKLKNQLLNQIQNELDIYNSEQSKNYVCICGSICKHDSINGHINSKKHIKYITQFPELVKNNTNIMTPL